MGAESMLQVTDTRTGISYDIPITDGAIRAIDLRQIRTSEDDFGLLCYDPAFLNTASCRSAITFIDGAEGILRYRGYPIEELARDVSFLDVAFLLLHGDLPGKEESDGFRATRSPTTPSCMRNVKKFIDGFHHDAHPMGILVSTIAACPRSTRRRSRRSPTTRAGMEQVVRLIAKVRPRWPRSPTGTRWACRTPIPTTTCHTRATSSA